MCGQCQVLERATLCSCRKLKGTLHVAEDKPSGEHANLLSGLAKATKWGEGEPTGKPGMLPATLLLLVPLGGERSVASGAATEAVPMGPAPEDWGMRKIQAPASSRVRGTQHPPMDASCLPLFAAEHPPLGGAGSREVHRQPAREGTSKLE